MRSITRVLILSLLLAVSAIAAEATQAHDVKVFTSDNADGKVTPKTIQAVFEESGFMVEANNDMNNPYKRDFNNTYFDVYNLMVMWRKDMVMALAKDYPEVGLYAPMTASIYTRKGDKTISVGYLSAPALAKIIGVPADNPTIVALGKQLEEALKKAMPNGKFVPLDYKMKPHAKDVITRVSFELKGDDWEEAKDEFQMELEGEVARLKFVAAAFTDLNYDLDENEKDWYTFYDVYSICKIPVIYQVSQKHPEAGAFGPCSMYMYQKKGEKTVHIAYTNVNKWIEALNIDDKKSLEVLVDAQKKLEEILAKLIKK
ncbi:MAG: DUF302 domain-containing protein [Campylobacterota bacterium]|nr:DUF302 domain-containing protein [Campylobacterota bacterium]